MKEATLEELTQRYRDLSDDQLLVLAADSSQLTPGAAAALRLELKGRNLSESEVAETRATVEHWRGEEDEYKASLFDPRRKIIGALADLAHLLVIGFLWLFIGVIARWLCHSPKSVWRFQIVVFFICFVPYVLWRVATAIKRWQRKKLLDNPSPLSSGPHSAASEHLNQK